MQDITGWRSDIAFEGVPTIDGRFIANGALNWRDLPLTLMAMTVNSGEGHEGAYVAGRIDALSKQSRNMHGEQLDPGVLALHGTGVFDTDGKDGAEVARLVEDETLRGISVDLHPNKLALRNPDTGELIDPEEATDEQWEQAFFGELGVAFTDATVVAATVCPTPAFDNAQIALVASAEHGRIVRVTSTFELVKKTPFLWTPNSVLFSADAAHANYAIGNSSNINWTFGPQTLTAAAPRKVPTAWFRTPEPSQPTPLTVTEDGKVYGHAFLWNACHTGYTGRCVTPPHSPTGYAYYMTGEVETLEGDRVTVGSITLDTGHADIGKSWKAARSHYDNTGSVVADVVVTDGVLGGWVSGALRDISQERADELRACGKLSGDWRSVNGQLDMIGLLAVNVAGYPVPRPQAALVAAAEEDTALSLVAAGQFDAETGLTPDEAVVRIEVLAASADADPIKALAELVL